MCDFLERAISNLCIDPFLYHSVCHAIAARRARYNVPSAARLFVVAHSIDRDRPVFLWAMHPSTCGLCQMISSNYIAWMRTTREAIRHAEQNTGFMITSLGQISGKCTFPS